MEDLRVLIVGQADFLLALHGLSFAVLGVVSFALARLDRSGLPWRFLAISAMAWGASEWLEMVLIGVDAGPAVPPVQMALAMVALLARAEFARRGLAALGGVRLGLWVSALAGLAGVSGVVGGTTLLWITLDTVSAAAGFWSVFILLMYRRRLHEGSVPLAIASGALAFYCLGTAVPFLHITWFLPGVAGGYPEGQILWISAAVLVAVSLMYHYARLWEIRFPDSPVDPSGANPLRRTAAALLILCAGLAATNWGGRNELDHNKEGLLQRANLVALGLDADLLRRIEGRAEDRESPAYRATEAKVRAMAGTDSEIRFLYGVAERGGRLFFTFDSTLETSSDFSPPGTPYTTAPPGILEVFRSGKAAVLGPYTDRWGTFISAFIPVVDRATGRVVQVVGMDVDHQVFAAQVAAGRLVFLLITILVAVTQISAATFRQIGRESSIAMEDADRRYRRMFQSHTLPMILSDPDSGVIRDANPAAADLCGMPAGELRGRVFPLLAMPSREGLRPPSPLEGERRGEGVFDRPDGERRTVEWSGSRVEVEGRSYLFAVLQDVTEKRRMEEERAKLEAEVAEAHKMESLGLLAGGIAHDFSNILQGILGHADLGLRGADQGSEAHRRLRGICGIAKRAADLCKLLLAYSGEGAMEVGKVDLAALVRETVLMVELALPKSVTVRCDLASDLPPVEADSAQIRQVILNLLLNAGEAMGAGGGAVAVTARRARCLAEGHENDEANCAGIEIRDGGCGMDRDTLKKIFQPFFTTKPSGRGLGLAAARGIILKHRGHMVVESEPGEGTVFKICLPGCEGAPSRPPEAPAPVAPETLCGRVLLVDDEPDVRDVASGMLEHLGFEVETAPDGPSALTLLAGESPFSAVLLDFTMPKLDGAETLRSILEARPGLPVILMSGLDRRDFQKTHPVEGYASFLGKPFTLDALARTLADTLAAKA